MNEGYMNGKREKLSQETVDVLQKIINGADLKWLFYLMVEDGYAVIVDIDYENGKALQFEEGLRQLQKKLKMSERLISEYLTPSEIDVYQQLLQKFRVE